MKAWLLPQLGSIDLLTFADVPDPVPAAGEVVLRLQFAALNPADRYLAEGMYPARPTFPHILGRDGIGTVESVGPGAGDWKVGDEAVLVRSDIGVNRPGTFAEKVAVPVESLVRRPGGWSPEQAAGATLVYLTAWQALTQWGDLPPGVVLITGASGGVGMASIHLGKAMGHTVVGLSRGISKVEALKQQGADHVLDPADTQWRRKLKPLVNGRKVDLAIDNIGGELFKDVVDVMADRGRISVIGQLAGPVPSFATATLFFRRLRIGGVSVGAYAPAESASAWANVVAALGRAGRLPLIDRVIPLADLQAAFARLREGPLGKILVRP